VARSRNVCTVTMDAAKSVTAVFQPARDLTLTLNGVNGGAGSVTATLVDPLLILRARVAERAADLHQTRTGECHDHSDGDRGTALQVHGLGRGLRHRDGTDLPGAIGPRASVTAAFDGRGSCR